MTTEFWDPLDPSLHRAIICYADILGFRARTERALRQGSGATFLRQIRRSLHVAYDKVREARTLGGEVPSRFDMKVFTDNLVVAYPLSNERIEGGEPEMGTILMLFAEVQASLAADGFLLRGAIAVGDHYQDDDIAYGPALFEAVDLDKSGGAPRLVLAPSAVRLVGHQLNYYRHVSDSPHYDSLLEDSGDGQLFVHYLDVVLESFHESGINYNLLKAHRDVVSSGLREHQLDPRVRKKYEWLATYHNHVFREFAGEWRAVQCSPEAGHEDLEFAQDAQSALNYLVHFKGLLPPRRLSEQAIQRLAVP